MASAVDSCSSSVMVLLGALFNILTLGFRHAGVTGTVTEEAPASSPRSDPKDGGS